VCGIAGLVAASDGSPVDEPALRAMTAALAARGPDGEGYHLVPGCGLGHRRLAIIDVEGGHQPLYSEDGQIAVVCNGEIYNFQPLRAELESLGHAFKTRSDSEVLAHGYEQWGDGILDRIEGMFALAIWDANNRRLLLARDRMGEKPLYYAPTPGGGLAFASELRSLRHAPGVSGDIDPSALARYLVFEYVPSPQSMLVGVSKLEPGYKLVARPGQPPQASRYWDLDFPDEDLRVNDVESATAVLLGELRRSVKERLVSDVPLGVFLSGGLDSSTVAALAAEVRGRDLDTFSIGFEDPSYDESNEARRVAQHIGSRHHEDRLSPQVLLEILPAIGKLLDEPIGDGSIVPTHLLARFARKSVTVALGGDGGDELFAGYPTFQAEWLAQVPGVANIAGLAARALPVKLGYFSLDFKLKQFAKGTGLDGPRRHQAWLGSFAPKDAVAALAPDVARAASGDLYDVIDRRLSHCHSRDRWDRLMYFYAKGYLADQVLAKVDRATMAVGLEGRAPLLDSKIVGLACRLTPHLRLRGMQTKFLLKRAMRGILPDATLDRKKQGFAMPIGRWLKGELRSFMEYQLAPSRIRDHFEPSVVRKLIDEHIAGQADHRKPLWTILAFQTWLEAWRSAAVQKSAATSRA
jgi:asparagine synthase (glutamine-hydrolysing)